MLLTVTDQVDTAHTPQFFRGHGRNRFYAPYIAGEYGMYV